MDAPAPRPPVVRRQDYAPPAWRVPNIELVFDLDAKRTRVTARLDVERGEGPAGPLVLDAEALDLARVTVDGRTLDKGDHAFAGSKLTIPLEAERAIVETEVFIRPDTNTQLMGLYASKGILCTQCEAEGFRRITPFPDRPDILSRYRVTLRAEKNSYPVLLSNGDPGEARDIGGGRHEIVWTDPHPKPSYLFAAVAGDLACLSGSFTTASGRQVKLGIWVRPGDEERCRHAMRALTDAMAWDERVYGREYDLDVFNIVAVDDFNFGAMENKGLNIFNSKFILADRETATDEDFDNIAGIVAHEYFHNWTGNRITCRDWFQLSLKEGLTVFRDQQFSADMGSAAVQRIEDVRRLRSIQFPEDSGPLAHPVRPESYEEISNFYTATVYNKGAELIRMMHRIAGAERFRAGTDLYFKRHDGEAATCEDWARAIEVGAGLDLAQFRRWYSQAGTPSVAAALAHDPVSASAVLTLTQRTPPTPGQHAKAPMHIPLEVALFGRESGARLGAPRLVELREETEEIVFDAVAEPPVLSINRGFTAPVHVETSRADADLAFLSANDDDPFARYEAMQDLMMSWLLADYAGEAPDPASVCRAVARTLGDQALDAAFKAEAVVLPAPSIIADRVGHGIDPARILAVRETLRGAIRDGHRWEELYRSLAADSFALDADAKGRRRLKNVALGYLASARGEEGIALAAAQYDAADNMTDRVAALAALADTESQARGAALAEFHARFAHDANVLDKWFQVQGAAQRDEVLADVERLARHPAFTLGNPNRFRALVGAFAGNMLGFHRIDGAGYRFVADMLLKADRLNPQTAARFIAPFGRWRRMETRRAALMRGELDRIRKVPGLSKDVREMTEKALGA